jgi:hypothetical protein
MYQCHDPKNHLQQHQSSQFMEYEYQKRFGHPPVLISMSPLSGFTIRSFLVTTALDEAIWSRWKRLPIICMVPTIHGNSDEMLPRHGYNQIPAFHPIGSRRYLSPDRDGPNSYERTNHKNCSRRNFRPWCVASSWYTTMDSR